MTEPIACWKCGVSIADIPLPIPRESVCSSCDADLHVCRLCRFYDTSVANHCRETIADKVQDKTRRNFCGYFDPSAVAYQERDGAPGTAARAELAALFGEPVTDKPAGSEPEEDPAALARQELGELFGGNGKDKD